jgi:hypothetical protein
MKFFFAYNKQLANFIKSKGFDSITTAINPISGNMFTLFAQSENLSKVIDEYKQIHGKGA